MKNLTCLLLLATFGSFVGIAQESAAEITADELKAHVRYLASDELEGRGAGTEGDRKAAAYLARQFSAYGLTPAGRSSSYYQEFDFVSAVKAGVKNAMSLQVHGKTQTLRLDSDFRPLGFSSDTSVSGAVVFAGFGISAPEKNYDDYAGMDVTGKIVIALRYGPDGNDIHSELYRFTSLRNKARYAREKGAAAFVLVDAGAEELIKLSYDQSFATSGIPCVSLKPNYLEQLLQPMKKNLAAIQQAMQTTKKPVAFDIPDARITLQTEVIKLTSKTANVMGFIEGSDPNLKHEVLVVGAHFDHLGYGGEGSGSLVPDVREIHNGADDNASGTAAMLELAQAFAARKDQLKRTVLFMGFAAEEIGLLGASHYVNNPFFPLDKTIAMINMDEVGRLRDNALTVYGTGTSPSWHPLLSKHNAAFHPDTFALKRVPDGFGPSDHAQFYGKDIPVLFFFTGTHPDYHRPSDDWDKVNYEGQERVTRFIAGIADDIQSMTGRPQFTKTQMTASMGGGDGRGFSVTLGVIPDYGETDGGMKIGGTRPNGPAEKAGLKSGDIITRLAGKKVLNIYDYMGILGTLKAGDIVDVTVLRDGKTLEFSVTMQKR